VRTIIPKWQNQGGGFGALQAPATNFVFGEAGASGRLGFRLALPPAD
jgi:hypothetical protein